tara:strand:+ start:1970 stop:2170 length:201 start_codon:yes stop_codon:yes gene_type:complete
MTDIERELDKINVKLEEMGFDIGRCVPFHKFDEEFNSRIVYIERTIQKILDVLNKGKELPDKVFID